MPAGEPTPSAQPVDELGRPDFEELALHKYIGVKLVDREQRYLGCTFVVTPAIEGREGQLNGGVLSVILDAVAYLALEPSLAENEDAVSHDLHISMLKAVMSGQTVHLKGDLVQRGRRVAFVNAEARADGRLVATARITKTIIQR
ncbi:MAG: PaaI family thioesterase [Actinobacteria bacterium]|uniref:Unannotated protein n=1 Tax=freshwater metagenome TaxID=449393 RepID=A0A6J6UAC3_9ZZZZ|nr:PaaI family thioesterase [Actinomycetota bacterium]MSZ04137.1 PaaI family thioesterase [Actinomycetota bacterium]MTB06921.1 PaaI family thioesterase [Actinomycetota bacterium]